AEGALKETERLLEGLVQQKSRFPLVYKLAALVAYSKGHVKEAIALLEEYQALWPTGLPQDQDARDLLTHYKQEAEQTATAAVVEPPVGPDPKSRQRPVRPGISASSPEMTAGTICCVVKDKGAPNGPRYIVGADHIFGTVAGTPVVQPGHIDGGVLPTDV